MCARQKCWVHVGKGRKLSGSDCFQHTDVPKKITNGGLEGCSRHSPLWDFFPFVATPGKVKPSGQAHWQWPASVWYPGQFPTMGDEQWLKEDGYLNVDTESTHIIYHPHLNVILVFTKTGDVKVIDVNSGVILQSCPLAGKIPRPHKPPAWFTYSRYKNDRSTLIFLLEDFLISCK